MPIIIDTSLLLQPHLLMASGTSAGVMKLPTEAAIMQPNAFVHQITVQVRCEALIARASVHSSVQ